MTSRRSSGSSWCDSAVEPTRSQNITVSCRRSASRAVSRLGKESLLSVSALPQPPQKSSSGSLTKSHSGHPTPSVAPHLAQKRRPSRFAIRHRGHFIGAPFSERTDWVSQTRAMLCPLSAENLTASYGTFFVSSPVPCQAADSVLTRATERAACAVPMALAQGRYNHSRSLLSRE